MAWPPAALPCFIFRFLYRPQPGGWSLLVCYGLAAQRSKQLRVFRKLDTLVLYLQQIGVSRFEVDASSFMLALRQR